jgi:hypothetical protein
MMTIINGQSRLNRICLIIAKLPSQIQTPIAVTISPQIIVLTIFPPFKTLPPNQKQEFLTTDDTESTEGKRKRFSVTSVSSVVLSLFDFRG